MRGTEIVEQPYTSENLTQRMTSEAIEYLERYVSTFYIHVKVQKAFIGTQIELSKCSD